MTQPTFWNYIKGLFKIKKISFGLFLNLVSLVLAILQINPPYAITALLSGTILLVWGLFEYSKLLYRNYEELKANLSANLGIKNQAESLFRDVREMLHKGIATISLVESNSTMKFIRFTRDNGLAIIALNINGLADEHIGGQIECYVQTKTNINRSSFPIKNSLGLVEIIKIDKISAIAYCQMQNNENQNWQDIISGIKRGRDRQLPKDVSFQPSIFESLNTFTKGEMSSLHKLLGKFSTF